MGRDKPKKYNKMNYQQKEVYVKDQLQKLGGGAVYYDNGGARGSASTGMFDLEASRDVLEKKMRNDFDYRTSAQHMDDIKGDASMSDFVNYQRGAQKLHKKAGNEGSYSSNKDITGVTNNLVQDYRRGIQDQFDNIPEPETKIRDKNPLTQDKPVELSERAQVAMENPLGEYGFSAEKRGFKGNNNLAYDPNAGVKSDKAGAFLGEYKLDIQRGIGKDGTPGRGPKSIHNKF